MSRALNLKCMAADPVPCPQVFHGGSEMVIARRVLDHLDAVHVHDGSGPSWGLSWRDSTGSHSIGIARPIPEGSAD